MYCDALFCFERVLVFLERTHRQNHVLDQRT